MDERTERVAAVLGHLHMIVAFDLGNLLLSVRENALAAARNVPADSEAAVNIQEIIDSTGRLVGVGKQIADDLAILRRIETKDQNRTGV